jgi:hypothetical protein
LLLCIAASGPAFAQGSSTKNPANFIGPATNAQGGSLVPNVSAALEATHVVSGAHNLYSAYVISTTGGPGWFVCVNSASALNGTLVPVDMVPIPPGPSFAVIPYGPGPAGSYGAGISCGVTTNVSPFTFTTGGAVFFYHIMAD